MLSVTPTNPWQWGHRIVLEGVMGVSGTTGAATIMPLSTPQLVAQESVRRQETHSV
jgi:hypothetical protein